MRSRVNFIKNLPLISIVLATIFFCGFTIGYEKVTAERAEKRIVEHAKIISDDLWNFNSEGAAEYLTLAAEVDKYITLKVIDKSGDLFQKISTPNINSFEQLLVNIGFNPLVTLNAPVKIHTRDIGWIEAVWIPKTYFLECYVFMFLVLFHLITSLYSRVHMSKLLLEDRVEERTKELQATNEQMEQEFLARIKAQNEQEKLRTRLEQSHKMESLGLLAGGVAHDLNNVLSGLVTYPDYLLLETGEDNPIREDLEIIRDSGIRASEIVQDLLSLTRRAVVQKLPLQLEKLVNEYIDSPEHAKLLEASPNTSLLTKFSNPLPPIKGSEVALKKLIMNLVSNAAEAQPGGGEITIELYSCELTEPMQVYQTVNPGTYTVLRVSDNGEGIDDSDLPRIFEPFYTQKMMGRSGTGLGLTVVWGTVEDHAGAIDVYSEKGKGTTLWIYFPATEEQPGQPEHQIAEDKFPGRGETILIVDDVYYQRKIASSVLTRMGYKVQTTSSGEEAVEILKKQDFDLLVLDMVLTGGMDGLDTYREVLRFRPTQKTIVVSGYSENERVDEMKELGVTACVQKPFTLEELNLAVTKTLRGEDRFTL